MYKNTGIVFEQQLISLINEKKYNELSPNLKNIVKTMFPNINDEDKVFAEHCDPAGKPDIVLTYNEEKHYLSLKTGQATIVHNEQLIKFLSKVEKMGVPKETINTLRKFHYGDGTLDGTGKTRLSFEDLFPTMITEIRVANEYLNESNEKMVNFVDTLVFKGNNENLPAADFIYHGNVDYGVICSRVQIIKHLKRKNYDYMRNLHIGPIQFHPYARFVDFSDPYPFKRELVNFKWVNLNADLEYISSHYRT